MRLEQLNYLMAVGMYRSMNKAAENIFVSQQSISDAIMELEEEFEIQLVKRTNRGSFLTDAGKDLVQVVRDFYGQIEQIKHQYQRESSNEDKSLELLFDYSRLKFYELISRYCERSGIELYTHIISESYGSLKKNLDLYPSAIAITGLDGDQMNELRKRYICQYFEKARLSVFVSKKSIFATYKTISLKSIRNSKILFFCSKNNLSFLYCTLKNFHLEKNNDFVFNVTLSRVKELFEDEDAILFATSSSSQELLGKSCVQIPLKEKILIYQCCLSQSNEKVSDLARILSYECGVESK